MFFNLEITRGILCHIYKKHQRHFVLSTDNATAIELSNIKFNYTSDNSSPILNIPSWRVDEGEHVFVVGNSGSGKSTLLGVLCGLLQVDSGRAEVLGTDLNTLSLRQRDRFRATNIGYIAQSFNLIPYLSVMDNIKLAISVADKGRANMTVGDIEGLLDIVKLPKSHWFSSVERLSIGQQQRVAIARAIINKPRLIIADEPTSSLDHSNRDAFIAMLMETSEQHNMTLVFVSHDLSLRQHFDRIDSMTEINVAGA